MATYQFDGPDGSVYEFDAPDNATDTEIEAHRQAEIARISSDPITQRVNELKNAMPNTFGEKVSDAVDRFGRGLADPLVGASQMYANSPLGSEDDRAIAERMYQENKGHSVEGIDWARSAGNMAATAPLGIAKAGAAATGALSAVLTPEEHFDWGNKAIEFGAGGILGKVLNPQLQGQAGTRELLDAGIKPTVGQVFNGNLGRLEELAQSLPIIGDSIRATRQAARDAFSLASINRVYDKLGIEPPKSGAIGFEGVDAAGQAVSQAYSDALSKIGPNTVQAIIDPVDHTFGHPPAMQYVSQLSDDAQKEFFNLIDHTFNRTGNLTKLTGNALQIIDSDLGALSRRYMGSSTASDKGIGLAIREVQNSLRTNLAVRDPDASKLLSKAREGFKEHIVLEKAAEKAMLRNGQFTPGQYATSAKQSKSSKGIKEWAAESANILGDKQPNSNTTERMLINAIAGGGAAVLHPPTLAGGIVGAVTASPYAQRVVLGHLLDNPHSKYQAFQSLFPLTAGAFNRELNQ